MIPYFPKQFSHRATIAYLASLVLIAIFYWNYFISPVFIFLGMLEVLGFFYFSFFMSKEWKVFDEKRFSIDLFLASLAIRVVWVVFSYFFYIEQTGAPFEWDVADAMDYHSEAESYCNNYGLSISELPKYYFWLPYSDRGYFYYLSLLYGIIGPSIVGARLIKALLSAFTVLLVYRFAKRNFGEETGRLSAVFCALMPNLIYYCGLHMKETEMLFLVLAFLERADYLLRSQRMRLLDIFLVIMLTGSLFFFRTVLGAVAVLSVGAGLLLAPSRWVGIGKKVAVIAFAMLAAVVLSGGVIATEVEGVWEDRGSNADAKRTFQTHKGVSWAKYATGAVMTPIIFVVPFATMVDVDEQYNQQLIHGGAFVKNMLGVFVVIALFYLLFKDKTWRKHSLLLVFTAGYLLVIATSGFSNAERFHIPTLPCLLVLAAYGVTKVNRDNLRFVYMWFFLVVFMELSWAFFKLGSRGLF